MFETTKIIILENSRNLFKKMKETPVLYFMFISMIFFSILIFSFATYFLINIETSLDVSLEDIFFAIFFVFMLKTVADFHNNFVKSSPLSYTLSTQKNQKRTVFEIFLAVLSIQLIIWFMFSLMYLLSLSFFGVNVIFPLEYIIFTLGVVAAVLIGFSTCINFFNSKKYRLLPTFILLGFFFEIRHPLYIIFTMPLAFLHTVWSINNSISSYLYINRKERTKEKGQVKKRSIIKAIFFRETVVLWRDKLLFSFIFTSVTTGLFSGYLFLYGDELLIPKNFQAAIGGILPSMFIFLSIYIVVMYTAVFPSLNLFLNEEKTMWLVRHLPVRNDILVFGKTSALSLCFLTAIPVVPYLIIFVGIENIFFLLWFLCFSYIAGVIISIPLGIKYVGKKSDIILLYSVAMILFVILGAMAFLRGIINSFFDYPIIIYVLILLLEIVIFYVSLKLSSKILDLHY